MRRFLLLGILFVIIFPAYIVGAQSTQRPYARETISVAQEAIQLTSSIFGGDAASALLTFEGFVRYTLDGTTPSSTVGHIAEMGDRLLLGLYELRGIKMVNPLTGTTTTVHVTYFKRQ